MERGPGVEQAFDAFAGRQAAFLVLALGGLRPAAFLDRRLLAAEFFDSNTVIGRLLDEVGIAA